MQSRREMYTVEGPVELGTSRGLSAAAGPTAGGRAVSRMEETTGSVPKQKTGLRNENWRPVPKWLVLSPWSSPGRSFLNFDVSVPLCLCVSETVCVSGDMSGSVYVTGKERVRQCTCVMHVCSIRGRNTGGQGEGQRHKQHPRATVSYALPGPNHEAPLPPRKEQPEHTRSQTFKEEMEFQENKSEGRGAYTCLVSRLARERRSWIQTRGREKQGQTGSPWRDALGDTE